MEDSSRKLPKTLDSTGGRCGDALADYASTSLTDRVLEKAKRLSFSVCDAYLGIQGIHDVLLPSITVVIPVAGRTEGLVETIESLFSARYSGLCISIVGLKDTAKIVEKLPRHPSIKFFEAPLGATVPEAIRPMLLWAPNPIIAWLEPGDTFSSNVLYRVGEIFRGKRAGAVLVPKHESLTERPASLADNLDFGFLSAQNASFPVKIFADRELYWTAAKIFAGTNYDCSDWAVALNTARFSKVQFLDDGYYQSTHGAEKFSTDESQKIKATISAQMWWTERFRHSVWRRCVNAFNRFASWHSKNNERFKQRHSAKELRLLVPPTFTADLAGFSSGEAIEFLGTYQWLFATPITRSVYFDRATEILIFQQRPNDTNQRQDRPHKIDVKVSSEEERHTHALAQGAENLFHGLFEPLRDWLGDHIEAASFSMATPDQAAESLAVRPPTANQTTELFDLLVVDRLLNASRRPHVLLRRAANQLKWSGWLIAGCSIFDFRTLDDNWPRSASMLRPDHELSLSAKALGDLLHVAGFTPRHVFGLTRSQVEELALESTTRAERIRDLAKMLFQAAPESDFKKSSLVILACQRGF